MTWCSLLAAEKYLHTGQFLNFYVVSSTQNKENTFNNGGFVKKIILENDNFFFLSSVEQVCFIN